MVPFITLYPRLKTDDFSAAELNRFKEYGLEKKLQQAKEILYDLILIGFSGHYLGYNCLGIRESV